MRKRPSPQAFPPLFPGAPYPGRGHQSLSIWASLIPFTLPFQGGKHLLTLRITICVKVTDADRGDSFVPLQSIRAAAEVRWCQCEWKSVGQGCVV